MANGGKRPNAGRPKGSPNKLSGTVKDNVIAVFDAIGGVQHMTTWAMDNSTEFYRLYSKLMPLQLTGDPENPITFQKIERAIVRPKD